MSDKIEYSIADLHNLFELGLRKSMFSNPTSDMHQVAVKNKDSIIKNGNPVYNRIYKSMNMPSLINHMNYAESNVTKKDKWQSESVTDYDIIIDDGHIEQGSSKMWYNNTFKLLSPYMSRNNLSKYQPYFEPTGRISDFAVAHSVGTVGIKFKPNNRSNIAVAYTDTYLDKDINCVTVIIDIGKNSDVTLNENFLNKDGLKVYKIVYLVRDFSRLTLERSHDVELKDKSSNIIDSTVIQFPNSTFNFTSSGEGSKHNQDVMFIDVYNECKTNIKGSYDLYGNYINNTLVEVHHIGSNSTSRVDVKSIVDDTSHSSFLGSIVVDQEAIGTDAQLINKNLLISNTATAITEPQLDINTKEIACSHGCTVSNIDKQQLYFLESRGIETNIAEETLKQCFLNN